MVWGLFLGISGGFLLILDVVLFLNVLVAGLVVRVEEDAGQCLAEGDEVRLGGGVVGGFAVNCVDIGDVNS